MVLCLAKTVVSTVMFYITAGRQKARVLFEVNEVNRILDIPCKQFAITFLLIKKSFVIICQIRTVPEYRSDNKNPRVLRSWRNICPGRAWRTAVVQEDPFQRQILFFRDKRNRHWSTLWNWVFYLQGRWDNFRRRNNPAVDIRCRNLLRPSIPNLADSFARTRSYWNWIARQILK